MELTCPPLFGTKRSPERPTLGPQVARIAEQLGQPLLPHQRYICDVAFEIDTQTGYLAYDEVVVIGPRQLTGKTFLIHPVMTHRCVGFGDALVAWVKRELGHTVVAPGAQRVLHTAQTFDKAKENWRDTYIYGEHGLKRSPFRSVIDVRLKTNMEAIAWPNGSSWSPAATTAKTGGTGATLDLGVIDESWSHQDFRTELAMRPAMLTRPWAQLWSLSMIPGLSRSQPGSWSYLRTKRQNGRARVQADIRHGMAFFDWAAAPGLDPGMESTWWTCLPTLGFHPGAVRSVRSSYEAAVGNGQLVDFCAEILGWEPAPGQLRWGVVSEATWRALIIPAHRGAYQDPVAFGVDAQPDQSTASIGMAARTVMGDTFVELIERKPGLNWTIPALVKLAAEHGPCAIGIAAHGPAASIIEPLRRALLEADVDCPPSVDKSIVKAFQGPDVSKACRQFFLETGEVGEYDQDDPAHDVNRRLVHIDQPELNASLAGAVKYTFSDEWRWQRSSDGGDASPLYSVTLARAAGESVEWLGGSYDIRDSLGGARQ
jgi:hypothetical protein